MRCEFDRRGRSRCSARCVPDPKPIILFTAFEPSGDDLAAAVIRALRVRRPDIEIFAWGGPQMAAAGATIVEPTGADAIVGLPGVGKIVEHVRMNGRVARWMDEHDVALHVPVDSPAANFPICKQAKKHGICVMHLAAPQLWAWAPWRIHKLRRLTDHVLCLLPFEEQWFRDRGVEATFIGHPLFDNGHIKTDGGTGTGGGMKTDGGTGVSPVNGAATTGETPVRPKIDESTSTRKLAIMPGSRPKELSRHMPLVIGVLESLRKTNPDLAVRYAVQDDTAASIVRTLAAGCGAPLSDADVLVGPDAVAEAARWADVCLTKSGTVTLHIAKERRPMVVIYRTLTWGYLLIGRWLLTTPNHAMPNLIAGRKIVDEFVPHVGGPAPIADAVRRLLEDSSNRERERHDLDEVATKFEGRHAAETAAHIIEANIIDSTNKVD